MKSTIGRVRRRPAETFAHRRLGSRQTRSPAAGAARCNASPWARRGARNRARPCSPRVQPSKRIPIEKRMFVSPRARFNALCYRLVYSLISQLLAMTVHSEARSVAVAADRLWKLVSSLFSVKVVGCNANPFGKFLTEFMRSTTLETKRTHVAPNEEARRPGARGRPRLLDETTRRDRLVAAAEHVFVEMGYGAASMDDIARRAGMSKKTIYQVFETKQESVRGGDQLAKGRPRCDDRG